MSVDRPQGLIEGSGQRGESRRLDQMVSARLDPTLVATLRQLGKRRGLSLSDVLREAALLFIRQEEAQNVITFCVDVTSERSGSVARESFRRDIEVAVLPPSART